MYTLNVHVQCTGMNLTLCDELVVESGNSCDESSRFTRQRNDLRSPFIDWGCITRGAECITIESIHGCICSITHKNRNN